MKTPIALLVILVLIFACYGQSIFFDFLHWDDPAHLLDNPQVLSLRPENIRAIFLTSVQEIYIPLAVLSYALEYHFYSFNPMMSHFYNVLLHFGVTALVFLFARQCGLGAGASLTAALIFGLHPMHVETVAWVTERKGLLYSLFYMAALCSHGFYLERRTVVRYVLTFIFGLLSVLAKPMALSLPLALLVCDRLRGRKLDARALAEKIPVGAATVAVAWITFASVGNRIPGQGLVTGALTLLWSFSFYIWKFFLPVSLVPVYQVPRPVAPANPVYFFSVLFVLLLAVLSVRWKRHRWFSAALWLYATQIFFVLRVNENIGVHVVADRYMYLPSLGFCLFLGYLFDRVLNPVRGFRHAWQKGLAKTGWAAYVCALAAMTFFQVGVWRNDIVLWTEVLRYNPGYDLAYHNRGYAQMRQGHYGPALADFGRALELNPLRAETYNNRGMIFAKLGDATGAMAEYQKALALEPESGAVFVNRGNLYRDRGDLAQAISDYERVIRGGRQEPLMRALAYAEKGYALYLRKEYSLARESIGQALGIFPDLDKALEYLKLVDATTR